MTAVEAACAFVQTLSGSALHADQSKVQSQKLIAMFAHQPLGSERLPVVLAAISGAGFRDEDLEALVRTLNSSGGPAFSAASCESSDYQNFSSFCGFLKTSQWNRAMGGEEDALDVLHEAIGSLGLRSRISEPTFRAVTAAVVLCTETDAKVLTMTDRDFKPIYEMVKKALKKRKGVPPIWHLPGTPELLKAKEPEFYDALFADCGPSKCPFPKAARERIISTIRCRGESKATSSSLVPANVDSPTTMTGVMMQGMQRLAEQQAAMLQYFAGAGAGGGGQCALTFPGQGHQQFSPGRVPIFGRADRALEAPSPGLLRCASFAEAARKGRPEEQPSPASLQAAQPEVAAPQASQPEVAAPRASQAEVAAPQASQPREAPQPSEAPPGENGVAARRRMPTKTMCKDRDAVDAAACADAPPKKANSGKNAMAMVLAGLDARDTKKRPAAAGASAAPKQLKTGPAICQCEGSRSQWMCRVLGGGQGSTQAFRWEDHGGMEKAHEAALKWVAEANEKAAAKG